LSLRLSVSQPITNRLHYSHNDFNQTTKQTIWPQSATATVDAYCPQGPGTRASAGRPVNLGCRHLQHSGSQPPCTSGRRYFWCAEPAGHRTQSREGGPQSVERPESSGVSNVFLRLARKSILFDTLVVKTSKTVTNTLESTSDHFKKNNRG
jgi:hypothetical protein